LKRKLISTSSIFEEKIAYSRAVIQNNWVFISGTTGYNYETMLLGKTIEEQTEQCFVNIEKTLSDAGAKLSDIVRITYILPDVKEFEKCWPILNKYLKNIKPAATMFSASLMIAEMKIEIQITALKQ